MLDDVLMLATFLSSTAGAGFAASWLVDQLRLKFARPTVEQWKQYRRVKRFALQAIWAPKWARYTVFSFSVIISLLFTGIGAWIVGEPVAPLLAACLSVWASQVKHAQDLSGAVRLVEPQVKM